MLSAEENRLLTETGPDTPMGKLFRRFWLPVLTTEDLPGPDCDPKRLRLLSEDLIAFRDSSGRVGIVDAYCPHRGAPMFFGRNEESGLRCVYHGWKFDVEGNCVDLPNAPEGETFRHKVKITAYAAAERGGIIWAYLGPKEQQPALPAFPFMDLPGSHCYIWRIELDCNYFQSMEGDVDTSHVNFLHSVLGDPASNPLIGNGRLDPVMLGNRTSRYTIIEDTTYGIMNVITRYGGADTTRVNIGHFMVPCFTTAATAIGIYQDQARVPIDDEHCVYWRIRFHPERPLTERELWIAKNGSFLNSELIPGTHRGVANIDNDYLIDRVLQRNYNYSGIKAFFTQDQALIENQRGPIQDRTKERLVSADESIIRVRRHILSVCRELEEGQDPPSAQRPEAFGVLSAQFDLSNEASLIEAVQSRLASIARATI